MVTKVYERLASLELALRGAGVTILKREPVDGGYLPREAWRFEAQAPNRPVREFTISEIALAKLGNWDAVTKRVVDGFLAEEQRVPRDRLRVT